MNKSAPINTKGWTVRLAAAVLCLCAAFPASGAAPRRKDNAALDYWKAAALMNRPRTIEQFDMTLFIRQDLPGLPPRVFSFWPEAGRWLLTEKEMIRALHDATSRTYCDFGSRRGPATGPRLDLRHIPMLRQLTDRALATAKAHAYAQDMQGAAAIYRDLFAMVANLDGDRTLASGAAAADLLQQIVVQLADFFADAPPVPATHILETYFRRTPDRLFHLGDYLRDEGYRISRWLMLDPAAAEKKLAMLYGRNPSRPGVDRLMSLPPNRKAERLQKWVMDYEDRMIRMAAACDRPFAQGISTLRRLDAENKALRTKTLPPDANPLIPLLVPEITPLYRRFTLAEGQFRAARVLTGAAAYRAAHGRWPVNLDEMHDPALPHDPFSGEPFYYKLVQVQPYLIIRIPKRLAARQGLVYQFDFARRQRERKKLLNEIVRSWQTTVSPAAQSAVSAPVGR